MRRVRVFLASSLDGFIAGPGDDLSWLPAGGEPGPGALTLEALLADVGAMLMGRRTYDVVAGFDGPWMYGEVPILVPTHRPLEAARPTVRAGEGSIDALLDQALAVAGERDVYLDGGQLVQQALAADRVDELVLTMVPIVLGGGVPLFDRLAEPRRFRFGPPATYGSMVQLTAVRDRSGSAVDLSSGSDPA
jgi:dihydrofolate reductase